MTYLRLPLPPTAAENETSDAQDPDVQASTFEHENVKDPGVKNRGAKNSGAKSRGAKNRGARNRGAKNSSVKDPGASPGVEDSSAKDPGHLAVRFDRPAEPLDEELAILYCHGFASSQDGEKADYLRRHFLERGVAFCSFDFRGHGESSGEIFDLSMSRNLDDVATVHAHLEEQGFRRLVLFGSSMGGAVSAWYACRRPDAVAAAVFIAPGLEMEEGLMRLLGPEQAALWRQEGKVLFEHELGGYWLSWQLIEDLRDYSRFRLARTYRTPTLIFQGMQDATVDWRSVVDFADSCEAPITLQLFSDGDHRLLGRLPPLWRQTSSFLVDLGLLGE